MYCQKRLTVACQSGFGGTERAWEPEVEPHGSFSPHPSTLKTTFIQKWLKKKKTYQQRAPERESEQQPSWLSAWTDLQL